MYREIGKTLYFNVETFIGRKTLWILKSSKIKQRFKSFVAAQLMKNVIRIYNVDIERHYIIELDIAQLGYHMSRLAHIGGKWVI